MSNRFQNILPGHRTFVPQQWTPNVELLGSLLESQQKGFDDAASLSSIPITNIRQDEEVAQGIRSDINSRIDNLSNIYKTDGISAGNREKTALIKDVRRMVLPGGKINKLGQRVETYKAQQDRIRELYKDQPILQQHHLKNLDNEGVLPFDDGRINLPQNMFRHVDSKEMSDWLNKTVDNIKDTDLERLGLNRRQLVNFNYLYETGKISGRKYQDIVNTLVSQLPQDFIQSAQQYSSAIGKDIDESVLFDEEGKLNIDTQLGRIISGAARGRSREDLDLKTGTFKDDYSLRLLDHEHNKKAIDYEYNKKKSFYEFPTTSKDVPIDIEKEQEHINLEKQKLQSATDVISSFQEKISSGENIAPEEFALYQEAIIDKNDSDFVLKAKGKTKAALVEKTGESINQRVDRIIFDSNLSTKVKDYLSNNPEMSLSEAYLASGGAIDKPVGRDKVVMNPTYKALLAEDNKITTDVKGLDESDKIFHRNYTLMYGSDNTELTRRSKTLSEAFLKGNINLVTDEGKLFNNKEVMNKFAEGKVAIVPVKEPINNRPGFAVISTKQTDGNFFSDGEYGKTMEYVTLGGSNNMIIEQNKRIYKDMYFNGDATDQSSAAYSYGYYTKAKDTNLNVGNQFETLRLESKPSGWSSDVPIKTPIGDIHITKFIGDGGRELYRHDLFKSNSKTRINDADGNPIYNLFNDNFGITDNPNAIVEAIGKYQLQLEANE